ncbi:SDR family NAD(P)-dependent oxidoreductase [Microbacterium sp. NIBRBAC000506063]|uniref:SDR family NAD(P)-dependent oxidoreductase n=1 Tax=Microbacterium sp. NIBRBAC000506063 TaxID=2734618 RepID=UPI001BB7E866|nr:glucose 1-dehydrogenase [Microbacterium sp. NIBRBAC000506063]QTV79330.1 glucose 1-dehydrogenase [Microbacterium sp. NIBRBAC000506063]
MSQRFAGDVVIVTGASRGQGASHARRFAAEGARVVIADLLEEQGAALAGDLGGSAFAVRHDVTSEESWAGLLAHTEARFGAVTVLVNNAGVDLQRSIEETSLEDFRRIVEVNQTGTFLGIRAVIPSMRRAGGGSIINISSIGGIHNLARGRVAYVAAKHAVRGMTKVAAAELASDGIRVNSVHPGFVDTEMFREAQVPAERIAAVPLGRPAELDEISDLVLFLASADSAYITATEHLIDGGLSGGF